MTIEKELHSQRYLKQPQSLSQLEFPADESRDSSATKAELTPAASKSAELKLAKSKEVQNWY